MKKKLMNKNIILIGILFLIPCIFTMIYFPSIPNQINIGWDAQGGIFEGLVEKWVLWIIPLLSLITSLILIVIPFIEPDQKHLIKSLKSYYSISAMWIFFFAVIQFLLIATVINNISFPFKIVLTISLGFLICIIGNYLPKIKTNHMFGIHTPWTMTSDKVWIKTHRFAGYLHLFMGIAIMLCSLINNKVILLVIIVLIIGVLLIVPIIFSFFYYQHIKNKKYRKFSLKDNK